MSAVTIWKDQADGNNHSLVWDEGLLTLTVIKPDGVTFGASQSTEGTAEQWAAAFASNGGQWRKAHQEVVDGHFIELRSMREQETGDTGIWPVDHFKPDGLEAKYILADGFVIM